MINENCSSTEPKQNSMRFQCCNAQHTQHWIYATNNWLWMAWAIFTSCSINSLLRCTFHNNFDVQIGCWRRGSIKQEKLRLAAIWTWHTARAHITMIFAAAIAARTNMFVRRPMLGAMLCARWKICNFNEH